MAIDTASEFGYFTRERDGAIEVEVPTGPPMSERLSRRFRVTVSPSGTGSVTRIYSLPRIVGVASTRRAVEPAFLFADRLAERLPR